MGGPSEFKSVTDNVSLTGYVIIALIEENVCLISPSQPNKQKFCLNYWQRFFFRFVFTKVHVLEESRYDNTNVIKTFRRHVIAKRTT